MFGSYVNLITAHNGTIISKSPSSKRIKMKCRLAESRIKEYTYTIIEYSTPFHGRYIFEFSCSNSLVLILLFLI